jgi:hypothetical protein
MASEAFDVKGIPNMSEAKVITIDEAIGQLQTIAAQSPLGGDTCLMVCIPNIEYQPVTGIEMDRSQDGAIALIMQPYEDVKDGKKS